MDEAPRRLPQAPGPPRPRRTNEQTESRPAAKRRSASSDSFINFLTTGGVSSLLKIGGAAGVTAALAGKFLLKTARKEQSPSLFTSDLQQAISVLAIAAMIGAVLGGLLVVKDYVTHLHERSRPVPMPLDLLFGRGVLSLVLVWVPLITFGTLVVSLLSVL